MPRTFAPFFSSGEYSGIVLKKNLLKALFLRVMRGLAVFHEKKFQSRIDNGNTSDHTFKFANGIRNPHGGGKMFTASYTVPSLMGFINLNRPTFTKANGELRPLLQEFKQVRKNAGKSLDYLETDGGADSQLWEDEYKIELEQGMFPFKKTKLQDSHGLNFTRTKSLKSPPGIWLMNGHSLSFQV